MPTVSTLISLDVAIYGTSPAIGAVDPISGTIFATDANAGASANGEVFAVTGPAGGSSTSSVIATFDGTDGANPNPGLVEDALGNLYGTTASGGANADGVIYEIVKTAAGYDATPKVLYSFTGADGAHPVGALAADAAGNLFGVTGMGGASGNGTVFELPKGVAGYSPTLTTVASFDGTNLQFGANLFIDANGNLFGNTLLGSGDTSVLSGTGVAFEVANSGTASAPIYASAPSVLANFGAAGNGGISLIDAAGNLFGILQTTASPTEKIFELAKTGTGYAAGPTILATFGGQYPTLPATLSRIDAAGSLFGTTLESGATTFPAGHGNGTVFELAKSANGYDTSIQTLATLGNFSSGQLAVDPSGALFGATTENGTAPDTVYQLTGTNFQVRCFLAGTLIATPRGARVIETLAAGDEVLTASGRVRPIAFAARRAVRCDRHPDPSAVFPIRVRANAFGPSLPARDLFLSPGHAVFLEGVLIPIRHLIDGALVAQIDRAMAIYHHLELDQHDLLLAENLPAESYLDTGGRTGFDGDAVVRLHPHFEAGRETTAWEALACAPLVIGGPAVERARSLLRTRRDQLAIVAATTRKPRAAS